MFVSTVDNVSGYVSALEVLKDLEEKSIKLRPVLSLRVSKHLGVHQVQQNERVALFDDL